MNDRIIPEIEYKEQFDFVRENLNKLFIDGFDVVQLKGFMLSPYDQEPCYCVLKFVHEHNVGSYFVLQERVIIMGLIPLEKLPDYEEILHLWNMNLERMEIKDFK